MPQDLTTSTEDLVRRVAAGERLALAKLITRVEAGEEVSLSPEVPLPPVVGITGSGGAGKSTLVAKLVPLLRQHNFRVAVLACDPASPKSGGALLGDRVRAAFDPADQGIYFRSLSTRGATGGISAAVPAILALLARYGADVVLIETVGVGQDQTAISQSVDCLVLLVTPGTGDEVQWEKAGLIELADIVAVNKHDLPGADRVVASLRRALSLSPDADIPPVLSLSAAKDEGLAELWAEVSDQLAAQGKQPRPEDA